MLFVICYLYYTILVRIQKLGFLVCVYGLLHLFRSQHCQSIGNDSNLLFADRYSVPHRCITFTGSARIRMLCSSWERGGRFVAASIVWFIFKEFENNIVWFALCRSLFNNSVLYTVVSPLFRAGVIRSHIMALVFDSAVLPCDGTGVVLFFLCI